MPVTSAALAEADRLMTICNSCRYCEGLCPVFPAMEMRRSFGAGDLTYLANLCHGCGACYDDCQFAPPHEFDVNLPKALARLRYESYAAWAWPRNFAGLFRNNASGVAIAVTAGVAAFIVGVLAGRDEATVFAASADAGAFYRVIPHPMLVLIFVAAFVLASAALFVAARRSWGVIGARQHARSASAPLWRAITAAATLRYLDGGGGGCGNGGSATDRRRLYHHLTAYGFLLCAASTAVATLYHYALGREAPYPWYDLPVVLGSVGGVGLTIGPAGLLAARWRRDPAVIDQTSAGMDVGFTVMLFLTGLTGLLLLILRATPAMGILLAVHLGVVLALFLTLPYGKFVHAIHRFLALVRYERDRDRLREMPSVRT